MCHAFSSCQSTERVTLSEERLEATRSPQAGSTLAGIEKTPDTFSSPQRCEKDDYEMDHADDYESYDAGHE
jgi:hypothetical protein